MEAAGKKGRYAVVTVKQNAGFNPSCQRLSGVSFSCVQRSKHMHIDTVRFSHLLAANEFVGLDSFLSKTAFVVCHKSEGIETLLGVLWYLPANSPIIVVTNCPQEEFAELKRSLTEQLSHHSRIYLVHQKDATITTFFRVCGVHQILGPDGCIVDGKGEGMYIGALCALLLGDPQWVIFFDADNLVPSALLEYTLAMKRLFLSAKATSFAFAGNEALVVSEQVQSRSGKSLHMVRICWASKPDLSRRDFQEKVLGRCTSVVSPMFSTLLEECFGLLDYPIVTSNAGEQGMTIETARTLRFSSGFSVETFQLLDLLSRAAENRSRSVLIQQYQAQSPHFHEKKGDEHIRKMIAESLGSFFHFKPLLSRKLLAQMRQVCKELDLQVVYPTVYPALQDLPALVDTTLMHRYQLSQETELHNGILAGEEPFLAA
jgi:mannosyl-3-phosphoglycerate synthase